MSKSQIVSSIVCVILLTLIFKVVGEPKDPKPETGIELEQS